MGRVCQIVEKLFTILMQLESHSPGTLCDSSSWCYITFCFHILLYISHYLWAILASSRELEWFLSNSGDASALPGRHAYQKWEDAHSSSSQIPAIDQTTYNASSGEQQREVAVVVVRAVKRENEVEIFLSYSHLLCTLKSRDSGYKISQLAVKCCHMFAYKQLNQLTQCRRCSPPSPSRL